MGKRIARAILSIGLVVAGAALIVDGERYHFVPVVQNREVTETITIPQPSMDMPPGPGMVPDMFERPEIKQTVTRLVRETNDKSEPALIRDVTISGLARLNSGELLQTYKPGEAPGLCHT